MKYIKPDSMTWWTGVSAIGFGIFSIVQGDVEGGLNAIWAGLAAIGLRAATPT